MPSTTRVLCVAHEEDAIGCLALGALDSGLDQSTRIIPETVRVSRAFGVVNISCVVFRSLANERIVRRRPKAGEVRFRGKYLKILFSDLEHYTPVWAPNARLVVLLRNDEELIRRSPPKFGRAVRHIFEMKRVQQRLNEKVRVNT